MKKVWLAAEGNEAIILILRRIMKKLIWSWGIKLSPSF